MSQLKRGISFYSYQDAYATQRYTLQQLLLEAHNLGTEGFEFITDQMMHKTPFPDEATLRNWDHMLEQTRMKPICNDIFINTKLYQDRVLTQAEGVEALKSEIFLAKRLGFSIVRMVAHTPWDIIQPVIEIAEQNRITLAFEIHGGMGFETKETQDQIDEVLRINSPYFGLVIDTSLFTRSLPRKLRCFIQSFGVSDDALDYVEDLYKQGLCPYQVLSKGMPNDLKARMKTPADMLVAKLGAFCENKPLTILDDLLPYVKHVHGKIYEAKEGVVDGFDTQEIVSYFVNHQFDGYIMTEYEGQRFKEIDEASDEIDTVREHQRILKTCIERAEREARNVL